MQTISKAARAYWEQYPQGTKGIIMDAFKAGVEFAQRWIPVDEVRMPNRRNILIKLESGKIRRFDEDWQRECELVTHYKVVK